MRVNFTVKTSTGRRGRGVDRRLSIDWTADEREAVIERLAVGMAVGLGAAWAFLAVAVLWAGRRAGPESPSALRLMGDTLRLLKDLVADRSLPSGVRWRLGVAIAYAGQPFNLIPDWIPVIGYADNIVVVCWALRSVIRVAGTTAVEQHWRGTPASLAQLYRLLRVNPQPRPVV